MKKYTISDAKHQFYDNPSNKPVYRICATRDIEGSNVKAGDWGGFIEEEENLSHDGDCWIDDDVIVSTGARVYGNARIYRHSIISEKARIYGNAIVDNSEIYNAKVFGKARITDAVVGGGAIILGNTLITNIRIIEKIKIRSGFFRKTVMKLRKNQSLYFLDKYQFLLGEGRCDIEHY